MTGILGLGSYLPPHVMTNDDMAKIVDTSDEWIVTRTGIHSRRMAKDETTLDMAEKAARAALLDAGVEASELSFVLVSTVTAEITTPTVAASLLGRLGATCPAMDINAACTGFLYGLRAACGMLSEGQKALVIGSEKLSRLVNWEDRATCVLFGDGAGAAVIGPGGHAILEMELHAVSDTKGALGVEGANLFEDGKLRPSIITMNGQEVYKFATRTLARDIASVAAAASVPVENIAWVVPHQANERILRSGAEKLGIPPEKFFSNIDHTGNTSSASVPIALTELAAKGILHSGDIVVLAAFGGGFTSGAALLKW